MSRPPLPPTGIAAADHIADALSQGHVPGRLEVWREALLDTLLDSRATTPPPRALWHPLGCLYLELARDAAWSVRVHAWGCGGAAAAGGALAVHAHDFEMNSLVLAGCIEHRVYEPEPGPPTHQFYEIEERGDLELLRPTGRCGRFEARPALRVDAGRPYRMPAGQYHLAGPAEGGSALSFVVAALGPPRGDALLGPLPGRETLRTERRPCSAAQWRPLLRRLREQTQEPSCRTS